MDYLDPVKKKAHRRRLYIGYGLMAIVVAFSTVILVYLGSGFVVDRQTGTLIQNGQILVASRPEGADIYLNDKLQKPKTTGKLTVPGGAYNIRIQKDGYRPWSLNVSLDGGYIERLDYVLLLPQILSPTIAQTFPETPKQMMQSPDKRYIAMLFVEKPNSVFLYDLVRPELAPAELTLPQTTFRDPAVPAALRIEEWSTDNKHVLLTQQNQAAVVTDYVLVSRDTNEAPVNISQRLGLSTQTIRLIDGRRDAYFVYDAQQKVLQTASLNDPLLKLRLGDVYAYQAVNEDTILYVTSATATDRVSVRLTDGWEKTYLIRELPKDGGYIFDVAKLGSTTVLGVGARSDNKVAVYRNPVGYLKANADRTLPLAATMLHIESPNSLSFSSDNSVIMVHSNTKIATHYFEEDKTTRFDAPIALTPSSNVQWLDGKHIVLTVGLQTKLLDFDGTNVQDLGTTNEQYGVYTDSNDRNMYSFGPSQKPFNIYKTSLLVTEK
jgi:hypothetical protein